MKQTLIKYIDKRFIPVCYRFNQEVFLADNFLRLGQVMGDPKVVMEHEKIDDFDFELLLFDKFNVRGGNINSLNEQGRKTLIKQLEDFLTAYWL